MKKNIDWEMLAAQEDVAEYFVHDRLTRESAFNCMVTVVQQMCEATATNIEDWRVPGGCNLRPVRDDECRCIRRSTGEHVLYNTKTRTAVVRLVIRRASVMYVCNALPSWTWK